jgi:hypothetical protein
MTELNLNIDKYDVSDNQIVVVKAPVGGMPPEQARDYLGAITKAFDAEIKRVGLENVACFVFPEQTAPAINVLDTPQAGSKVFFSVPLGNLPAKERIMYLKMTRDELRNSLNIPDCEIHVVPADTDIHVQ